MTMHAKMKPAALGAALFVTGVLCAAGANAQMAPPPTEFAATSPVFLQLEVTSTCTEDGAQFKVINRGSKWPRTGFLRLYHTDNNSMISERRVRLGEDQKVSFVVRGKVSQGRPVGIWIEPEWYKRDFEYDAALNCK